MGMPLVMEKSNSTDTTVELTFVPYLITWVENENFNPTGTIFDLKFVCFWIRLVQNLK